MGKTFRHYNDDDNRRGKANKNHNHSNGKKTGGMRVINDIYDGDDDYFQDDVKIEDEIVINKNGDNTTL